MTKFTAHRLLHDDCVIHARRFAVPEVPSPSSSGGHSAPSERKSKDRRSCWAKTRITKCTERMGRCDPIGVSVRARHYTIARSGGGGWGGLLPADSLHGQCSCLYWTQRHEVAKSFGSLSGDRTTRSIIMSFCSFFLSSPVGLHLSKVTSEDGRFVEVDAVRLRSFCGEKSCITSPYNDVKQPVAATCVTLTPTSNHISPIDFWRDSIDFHLVAARSSAENIQTIHLHTVFVTCFNVNLLIHAVSVSRLKRLTGESKICCSWGGGEGGMRC